MLNGGTECVAKGLCEGLELFIKVFNVSLLPFFCLENKNSIHLCPTLQSFPSVLR